MSTSGPSARGASTKHYRRDEISDGLAHLAATDHLARDEEGSSMRSALAWPMLPLLHPTNRHCATMQMPQDLDATHGGELLTVKTNRSRHYYIGNWTAAADSHGV